MMLFFILAKDSSKINQKGTLIAETVLIVKDKILNVNISSFIKRIAIEWTNEYFLLIVPEGESVVMSDDGYPRFFWMKCEQLDCLFSCWKTEY